MVRPQDVVLPLAGGDRTGCGPRRPSRRGRRRALVLVGVHLLFLAHLAHWKVAGRTLSPLEPSEAGETLTLGYVNAGFVLLVLLLAGTLLLGRFFCGWGCHVVALQDGAAWLLGRLGLRPRPLRARFLAFVPLFCAFEMFALPSLLRWLGGEPAAAWRWHLTTADFWGRFPGPWMALLTFLVVGFLAVWALGAKGFCTYGCPYGALFGLADRFAPGRIRVSDACEQCGHCTAVCTSNVRVHEEVARFGAVVDPGCMKCMDCVSVCPKEALSFGLRRTVERPPAPRRSPRPSPGRDLGLGEELASAAVFLAALYALRDLYGSVPFLLAVASAVLVALAVVAGWRLLRARSFTFQHHVWKRDGRLAPGGALALAGSAALLAFVAHSGVVQFHGRQADAALARAQAAGPDGVERARALERARGHLSRALALALVDTSEPHNKLGQVLAALGRPAEAEPHLLRAVELLPASRSARVYLADLAMRRGERDRALAWLEELAKLAPRDPELLRRLQALASRAPDDPRVRALLESVRGAGGP